MVKLRDRVEKLVDHALDRAESRASDAIRNGVDDVFAVDEDDEIDGDEADDDDDAEDDEDGSGGDGSAFASMSFMLTGENAARVNQMGAVAAWRALGGPGDFVCWHESGIAFFGNLSEFRDFCESNNIAPQPGWMVEDRPEELLEMDFDLADMIAIAARELGDATPSVQAGERPVHERETADEVYKAVHWGEEAATRLVTNIRGVSANLVYFGRQRYSEYFARKAGDPTEFWHQHGEESGVFPMIFIPAERKEPGYQWILIAAAPGSKFRVEDDGEHD